ncbi:MAG: putative membrane protein [Saprospiraceae bacterium]
MGPIVLCFAIGIIICNLNLLPINSKVSGFFRDGTVLMALPMLLYSSDVKAWVSESRLTLYAFGLCLISGLIGAGIGGYVFQSYISESWIPAGMMVGISSGGTPNLFAVGIALEAKDEVFTLTNSSQIFWGAIYLIFLLSLSARVFGWFLKIPKPTAFKKEEASSYLQYNKVSLKDSIIAILITIGIVAFSVGVSFAVFGKLEPTIIIVFITSLGIISSLSPAIRKLRGPFEIGDYLLLMFGISVGMVSDFHTLLSDGGPYILFVFLIMFLTVSIHMLLCKLFKIDRDTFIITSTAGIYGPVFISQIAYSLKNKSLIVGGMAVSLLGLALGNYLGIGLAYFLKWIL